ncbi:ureidoglycolate hydrolase [Grosmannia clavigera kw1407]|uniref:Ureidoglycolate hydrolase n=1 Tax=Grosmannia clavigera (strain kw1407 / UAMH 11150) TaxID=655863 RepID=F0XDN7_GROCL|nr:ureidoglycolate hydrolase [Grosmannia clavigera kw1407]EFX04469.1 ureidoglycolate hydrolase [Grosmannia clavigera kw1407]
MPARLDVSDLGLCVLAEPLTVAAFAPFGDVIENPRPDVQPGQYGEAFGSVLSAAPFHPVSANQGSAIKYQHVSRLADRYAADGAPSGQPSAAVANVFVCAARTLVEDPEHSRHGGAGLFPVTILERHPYTTQTFVPLTARGNTRYLVIVAPTLASNGPSSSQRDRRGPPDVHNLRAFVARGDQAVTYGAGTWHAPMAALGASGTSVAYAVFQFANGVGPEDCQETVLDGGSRAQQQPWSAVTVRVPATGCVAKL